VWVALDADTRQVVALFVGDRDIDAAGGLWESLPDEYRRRARCYTDFWEAYAAVIPRRRHRPSAKGSGKTNHVERWFNTLRQRCARVVRKTLSFSRKVENLIGALWFFVHHYNASL
jgi:insertion element IS1 protein InsB